MGMANLAFATLCPLGAAVFVWGLGMLDNQAFVVGCALAFSAGVFLCISLGDLLPEVHFHSHDRVKLTLSFLVGISLAPAGIPGIFAGSQALLAGRYEGEGEATVTVTGDSANGPETFVYDVFFPERDTDDPAVSQLWAQRYVADLLTELRIEGVRESLSHDYDAVQAMLDKIERYTQQRLKRRVIDGLKPRHKEAKAPGKPRKKKKIGISKTRPKAISSSRNPSPSTIPIASGLRSPAGIGDNEHGALFCIESQGPWNSSCSLKAITEGSFHGHPVSFNWYPFAPNLGEAPNVPEPGGRRAGQAGRAGLRCAAGWCRAAGAHRVASLAGASPSAARACRASCASRNWPRPTAPTSTPRTRQTSSNETSSPPWPSGSNTTRKATTGGTTASTRRGTSDRSFCFQAENENTRSWRPCRLAGEHM